MYSWPSVIFVVALALASPVLAQTPNLAANHGFEQWPDPVAGAPAWAATSYSVGVEGRDGSAAGRAYRSGEGELDTERHSGKYAQYMQTTAWGRGAIARGLPVTVGNRYRISVWVKGSLGQVPAGGLLRARTVDASGRLGVRPAGRAVDSRRQGGRDPGGLPEHRHGDVPAKWRGLSR